MSVLYLLAADTDTDTDTDTDCHSRSRVQTLLALSSPRSSLSLSLSVRGCQSLILKVTILFCFYATSSWYINKQYVRLELLFDYIINPRRLILANTEIASLLLAVLPQNLSGR